jgi:hypothetical protein
MRSRFYSIPTTLHGSVLTRLSLLIPSTSSPFPSTQIRFLIFGSQSAILRSWVLITFKPILSHNSLLVPWSGVRGDIAHLFLIPSDGGTGRVWNWSFYYMNNYD